MTVSTARAQAASAAFFCPQTRAPKEAYLNGVRKFLAHSLHGQHLLEELKKLEQTWSIFADTKDDIRALPLGLQNIRTLANWAENGTSAPVSEGRSGIIVLPLLIILQIGQYLRYLEYHDLSHAAFITEVKHGGGMHGYCGGLGAAIAIACSKDESQVVKYASTVLRILVGVGAYGEAAEGIDTCGTATLALRLRYEGQGDELVHKYPGVHISAVTDPKSISVVGPEPIVDRLINNVQEQGLPAQKMDVTGKVHNPENHQLATELSDFCDRTPSLKLPDASMLRVCVRSNRSGEQLLNQSLSKEIVTTILASKCNWYDLLNQVAADFNASQRQSHTIVTFGMNDCVPMLPFHKRKLQIDKIQAHTLIRELDFTNVHDVPSKSVTFSDNAIAITGASCRLPGANNIDELWDMLSKRVDCHGEILTDRFDLSGSYRASQAGIPGSERKVFGNFLDDVTQFDNSFFKIHAREATNMDPQQRILLELSYEALEDSGYLALHRPEAGDPVGCFIGASFIEYLDNTNAYGPTAYTSTGTIRAFLCGRLSHYYGWSGPAEVIDTACSSSLVAINRACKAIQSGECSMALAGGVNIITGVNNFLDLGKAGFLSPTGQCKPFDKSADGYCRSDGAGIVILKRLTEALDHGDQILGVVLGSATNQGGLSPSITIPHSLSLEALYQTVLRQAGLRPDQVSYVEAHGTGTQAGDPNELESVRSVFGDSSRSDTLHIGSVKGNLGHCETAAGVAGLLKVLAMIKHGQIPPQASHHELNPKIPPLGPDRLAISQQLRSWGGQSRVALVNSYGAAGSNAALLCCEMPSNAQSPSEKEKRTFPIILSAASNASLLACARTSATYLREKASHLQIGDVAFTLNERRGRHKFCIGARSESVLGLARSLETAQSLMFEYPAESKPVVLCFSGQSQSKVALDRNIYNAYPHFRHYIDTVDLELKELGFPSIFPAIFQSDEITDAVRLQCSMFALQYACACCWVDAGLRIETVVGHSLGELSALAVSGVLSLRDCTKLIASRARLIDTTWGSEKGAMLSIQATSEDVNKLNIRLQSGGDQLTVEIACYNAVKSVVVVGSVRAIDSTEDILRMDPDFQQIKFQRLKTSHGFHSKLAEPILAELNKVSTGLTWNKPQIPIELCKEDPIESMLAYSVSEHARQPVFFTHAIQRIEDRLGSCVWFEAGMDTSIVSMVRRASRKAETHEYQATTTMNTQVPDEMVSGIILSMWWHGISLSHWSFLPKESRPWKHVWLPPYQFDRKSHWLPNIDRAMEMQRSHTATTSAELLDRKRASHPQMVTKKASGDESSHSTEFCINSHSQRFQKIVDGHAVRQRPLCPASLYMEWVTMAVQLILGDIQGANLSFEDLEFPAALGLNLEREVNLTLEELTSKWTWKFAFHSLSKTGSTSRATLHANGRVSLVPDPNLTTFQRIIKDSMNRLEMNRNVERLMSQRAYGLFASVVRYKPFFRGISSITLHEREAVAIVRIPEDQPSREESTSWQHCDAVVVDNFIHTVGLLMNSSDAVSKEEVLVATKIERAVISSACKMNISMPWRVYARFANDESPQSIGDVFVFGDNEALVAMLSGCHFTKIPISRLEKSLDSINVSSSPRVIQTSVDKPPTLPTSDVVDTSSSVPDSETGNRESDSTEITSPSDIEDAALMKLFSEYIGVPESEMPRDAFFGDLGLDSLASQEIVGELQRQFRLDIGSDQIARQTIDSLVQCLSGKVTQRPVTNARKSLEGPPNPKTADRSATLPPNRDASKRRNLLEMLVDTSGAAAEDIEEQRTLAELGIDSLSLIDLKHQIESCFATQLENELFTAQLTVEGLFKILGVAAPKQSATRSSGGTTASKEFPSTDASWAQQGDVSLPNPFEALTYTDTNFEKAAGRRGFVQYWSGVSDLQDKLLLAYISEAFSACGKDLSRIPPGALVPEISHIPKYKNLMQRLYDILERHSIVSRRSENVFRGPGNFDGRDSSELYQDFKSQFPNYRDEANLMELTGSKLASCLSGRIDPVSLMFGSQSSLKIMENYYGQSPMLSTLTEQLVNFITTVLKSVEIGHNSSVRILEVGAGTGGTSLRLAKALETTGIPVRYTFTDISSKLVSAASKKLGKYSWMDFVTFDLEEEVTDAFRNKFDIVIGTNCVHATTDRTASCRRLRDTLKDGGFIILSEVVRVIDWYDICFGLLDGWWLAEGGTTYPIQPASEWMSAFKRAGFVSVGFSQGLTPEANTQKLLVGCTKDWKVSEPVLSDSIDNSYSDALKVETMVYKEVSGIQIHADVYLPHSIPESPAPIALMIHGGGHMALSRKSIRPHQTRYLISNGFVPVSVDYRLCPEVNLVEGPITDVRDAYVWVRDSLPQMLLNRGIAVDGDRVVVIGWSTGGHLALSIGWTAKDVNAPPPTAVLGFYAPFDFESGELDASRTTGFPERRMSIERILQELSTTPITTYDSIRSDATSLGWLRPGDPRSELVLLLMKEGTGLSFLVNGLSPDPASRSACFKAPTAEKLTAISPLAQVRLGNYHTPTYIIHGTDDEIAPFPPAERFAAALRERNVECEFLTIEKGKHTHDLALRPGMKAWEESVSPGYLFLSKHAKKKLSMR